MLLYFVLALQVARDVPTSRYRSVSTPRVPQARRWPLAECGLRAFAAAIQLPREGYPP